VYLNDPNVSNARTPERPNDPNDSNDLGDALSCDLKQSRCAAIEVAEPRVGEWPTFVQT
jgi:hypothetical protein